MIVLENQILRASIQHKGAELTSLIKKENGEEYLWQADPAYWNRHAPVLFPIVGRLKDNRFEYNGKSYILGQHGFARDSSFACIQVSSDSAIFRLTGSDLESIVYPFDFEFEVQYSLDGNTLHQQFTCLNKGTEVMYFSFGGHPAFNADPIDACELHFSPGLEHDVFALSGGCIMDTPVSHLNTSNIALNAHSFDSDALIFNNLKNTIISLNQHKTEKLRVHTDHMPYLGIWSKPGAPFVCIEPWDGVADFENHDGNIKTKRGIISLDPQKRFTNGFKIEIC